MERFVSCGLRVLLRFCFSVMCVAWPDQLRSRERSGSLLCVHACVLNGDFENCKFQGFVACSLWFHRDQEVWCHAVDSPNARHPLLPFRVRAQPGPHTRCHTGNKQHIFYRRRTWCHVDETCTHCRYLVEHGSGPQVCCNVARTNPRAGPCFEARNA